MKRNQYQRTAAGAGGGTSNVPFYEFVLPNLYIGDIAAALVSAGVKTAGRGVDAVKCWKRERSTRVALEALDDAVLADIGVERSQIRAIAKAVATDPSYSPSRHSR